MAIRLADRPLRTKFGTWREYLYYDGLTQILALVFGEVREQSDVLCRVHSDCISAHVFNSVDCDCREQLAMAQALIQREGCGVLIWLDQDGRGNGHLALMLSAAQAEEEGISQTEAYERNGYQGDNRSYGQAAAVLRDLGVRSVQLLSDSPDKATGLERAGVPVTGTRSVAMSLREYPGLENYYRDKADRGYSIDMER